MVAAIALLMFQAAQPETLADKRLMLAARAAEEFRRQVETLDVPDSKAFLEKLAAAMLESQSAKLRFSVEIYANLRKRTQPAVFPGGRLFVQDSVFSDPDMLLQALAHGVAHLLLEAREGPSTVHGAVLLSGDGGTCFRDSRMAPLNVPPRIQAMEKEADELAATLLRTLPEAGVAGFEEARTEMANRVKKPTPPTLYRAREK